MSPEEPMRRRELRGLLAAARGEAPADLLLTGGRVVNVLTGEVESADVALAGPWIAGVGPGQGARKVVDLDGAWLLSAPQRSPGTVGYPSSTRM